jgi:hypothetical protein
MFASHHSEQWVVEGVGLPGSDGVFVQPEEDTFATVLHHRYPGRCALCLEWGHGSNVVGFGCANAREAAQSSHHAKPVRERHTGELRREGWGWGKRFGLEVG